MRPMLRMILGWFALLLAMSAANAGTIRIDVDEFTLVVTEGKLSAIEGFRVNGETYDVVFAGDYYSLLIDEYQRCLGGQCSFYDVAQATSALTALHDRALVDLGLGLEFDSNPFATSGCEPILGNDSEVALQANSRCMLTTPVLDGGVFEAVGLENNCGNLGLGATSGIGSFAWWECPRPDEIFRSPFEWWEEAPFPGWPMYSCLGSDDEVLCPASLTLWRAHAVAVAEPYTLACLLTAMWAGVAVTQKRKTRR